MYYFLIAPILSIIAVAAIGKYRHKQKITIEEFIIILVLTVGLSVGTQSGLIYMSLANTEILNGEVLDKYREVVPCEHSYEVCDSKGKNCKTEYEHAYDYDWIVSTSVGKIEIDRVDRQGVSTPKRWIQATEGEPVARKHHYIDYTKGNRESIFKKHGYGQWEEHVKKYPRVFDYYRITRVLVDTENSDVKLTVAPWNSILNDELRTMGSALQINLIVMVTDKPIDFFRAQMHHWQGGKKNDLILAYGMDGTKIKWFESTSFMGGQGNNALHAMLRNAAVAKEISTDVLDEQLEIIKKNFVRKTMESEYVQFAAYEPPWWLIVTNTILSFLVALGLVKVMAVYDVSVINFIRGIFANRGHRFQMKVNNRKRTVERWTKRK